MNTLSKTLNELLSETLPPKGLIELSAQQQVDKSTLLVTKKSAGTISLMDLAGKTEKEIETDQQYIKQRSAEQHMSSLSTIQIVVYYVLYTSSLSEKK